MTDASRGEKACLAASAVLYLAGFFLGVPADWRRSAFFLPTGLLALALMNARLRSRVLAWGAFTLAFVLFMMVLGPFVVGARAGAPGDGLRFARAMGMYLSLAATALFQLRAARQ